jgi:hypothetical protein
VRPAFSFLRQTRLLPCRQMNGTTPYEIQFLKALLSTIAVETLVLFLVVRLWFRIQHQVLANALLVFAGIFCSAATLPYLWFVLPRFLKSYALLAVVGELLVFLVEAVFYNHVLKIGVRRSLLVSFVCNLASVMIGLLLM